MEKLISNFSEKNLADFFKTNISSFKNESESLDSLLNENKYKEFSSLLKIGSVEFGNSDELIVFSCKYNGQLTERSSKKKQFEIAKTVLKEDFKDGAVFVFYDASGNFRFSFIRRNWDQKGDQKYSTWKRYTYFVDKQSTNKTFKQRIGNCTFKDLESIQDAFSVEKLTKDFYSDLFKWYQWTLSEEVGITFPNNTDISEDDRVKLEEQVIRLITRVLFVWFIKQKQLVPEYLFNKNELKKILKDFDPVSTVEGNYYNAILQNLFFATLNRPVVEREFAKLVDKRDIKTKYRYAEMFNLSEEDILELFRPIPFLNGGLFECLDKDDLDGKKYFLDGFSRNDKKFANGNFKHRAFIPNCVFFDDSNGLIPILERYNFTVEENAPNEIQVALDPELLGNVFENLLGAFNEETKETARKQSGSFYTPREVVTYMVDESLIAYLTQILPSTSNIVIRQLFQEEDLPHELKNDNQTREKIATSLKSIKILDPACGSGAFPMGILNRMVDVLDKLDARSEKTIYEQKLHLIEECIYGVDVQTIATQISKLRFFISLIVEQESIDLSKPEENYNVITLPNLETKFVSANTLMGLHSSNDALLNLTDPELNELRDKLYQIRHDHFYAENAYKKKELRRQDQQFREEIKSHISENLVKPDLELVKNLEEFILVQQNERKKIEGENWVDEIVLVKQASLFGDEESESNSITKVDINKRERDRIDKSIKDAKSRIEREFNKSKSKGFEAEIEKLAKWDPYDQNSSSGFFDITWMFGLEDGFDLVIGNPPYLRIQGIRDNNQEFADYLTKEYKSATGAFDLYIVFLEKSLQLIKSNGIVNFIMPTKWTNAAFGKGIRKVLFEKKAASKIINFGAYQVFNASTYTGLQWFQPNSDKLLYFELDRDLKSNTDLSVYLNSLNSDNNATLIEQEKLAGDVWTLTNNITSKIIEKLNAQPRRISDVFDKIFQGLATSKDDVYFLYDCSFKNKTVKGLSKQLGKIVEIEEAFSKPLLKGDDVHRYDIVKTNKVVLFPYKIDNGNALLYSEEEIKDLFPKAYKYLKECEDVLRDREKGRFNIDGEWFQFGRKQGINFAEKEKLVAPEISLGGNFSYDKYGQFYSTTTIYGYIKKSDCTDSYRSLMAIMNSKVLWWFLVNTGTVLANGYFRFKPNYLYPFPVPVLTPDTDLILEKLVERVIEFNRNQKFQESIEVQKEIDRIIYNLYGLTINEIETIESC